MRSRKSYQQAFSIVELGMVLIIVGLIVGGTLTAMTVFRQAELRSIVSDVEAIRVAVDEFEQQYDGLPGDIYNATDFWAGVSNGGVNGNHNGRIDPWNTEGMQAWAQLVAAGRIKGTYTGATIDGDAIPGQNVMESKREGAGYSFYYVGTADATWKHSDTPGGDPGAVTITNNSVGNAVIFGGWVDDSYTSAPRLSPEEAQATDDKLDDGWPDSGAVQAPVASACTTTTGDPSPNDRMIYDTATNGADSCALAFRLKVLEE